MICSKLKPGERYNCSDSRQFRCPGYISSLTLIPIHCERKHENDGSFLRSTLLCYSIHSSINLCTITRKKSTSSSGGGSQVQSVVKDYEDKILRWSTGITLFQPMVSLYSRIVHDPHECHHSANRYCWSTINKPF